MRLVELVTGHGHGPGDTWEPIVAYLLERPPRGRATGNHDRLAERFHLIDTGLCQNHSRGHKVRLQFFLRGVSPRAYRQSAGESLGEQLDRLGVATIGGIFLTHLHFEQTSGLADIRGPVSCVVGHAEAPPMFLPFPWSDLGAATRFEELSFENAQEMPPLGPCVDIFGDGTLWAISTPGHTLGHVSYLAMDESHPILVTGGLAASLRGANASRDYGKHRELWRFSQERLREFLASYPEVLLAPGLQPVSEDRRTRYYSEGAEDEPEHRRGLFE